MTSAPKATDAYKYHYQYHHHHAHPDKQSKTCRHDSPFLESNVSIATALVILNSPIQSPPSLVFQHLWDSSSFRVAADGGANRLYDSNSSLLLPDAIRGDLDSLRPNVRAHYEERGVSVTRDCDQNTNDLDKALQLIYSKSTMEDDEDDDDDDDASNRIKRVCVFGAFGGRFDQEMGCIQALFKWSETFDYKLFLFDDNTCAFLLPHVVLNEIRLPFYGETPLNEQENAPSDLVVGEGPTCGLIPIGHRCEFVHTTGLKWDLDGCALEFGGMVSTSNRAMREVITVQASHPLVFTAEMTSGNVTR
jgi:thiamine pyrophosphokinase